MNNLLELIKEDCKTYINTDTVNFKHLFVTYIKIPGFKVTTHMRICEYLSHFPFLKPLYILEKIKYRRLQVKYGIIIGHQLNVGGGFHIEHWGGIVISAPVCIGKNFEIRQNTTIGQSKGKYPVIGNNVKVGTGAVVIGGISIGDNSVIGAGAVVVDSFPENSIIVGVPAKMIGVVSSPDIF